MLRIDREEIDRLKVTHDVHHSWLKATPPLLASASSGLQACELFQSNLDGKVRVRTVVEVGTVVR